MTQSTTLEKIKHMAQTAAARGDARKAVVDGRMKAAKIKHMINKPRPRVTQPQP
ncbi:MAG: hypothetical protein HQM02_13215 [Magnetococcales bacterium]|nr:hypothetical protein [Magnetococcales bacterium]